MALFASFLSRNYSDKKIFVIRLARGLKSGQGVSSCRNYTSEKHYCDQMEYVIVPLCSAAIRTGQTRHTSYAGSGPGGWKKSFWKYIHMRLQYVCCQS